MSVLWSTFKKSDFYKDVVSKASSVLQMDIDSLSLFRASGIVIADTPLTFGKSCSIWTMGRYLNKLHTSPDKLHLGIGVISGTSKIMWKLFVLFKLQQLIREP